MLTVVALSVAILTVSLTVGALRWTGAFGQTLHRSRVCPSCDAPMEPLVEEAGSTRTYEVLACPSCTNTLTAVHGAPSQLAYCPACRQRSLATPVVRLPDTPKGETRAEVHEHCHLCSYHSIVLVPEALAGTPVPAGKVIRFPSGRR